MAKASRKAGSTSNILLVRILDSTKTDGSGKTGLAYNTSGITMYYKRDSGSASVAITPASITTLGTFVSGGFKEVDATNMPGLYEFHPPDAALASGAKNVVFDIRGMAGAASVSSEIELTGTDNQDAVHGGMSAIPNAAANSAGGLLTFGTGAGQINVDGNGNVTIGDGFKKNAARPNFMFMMTDTTTHAPKVGLGTGLTITRDIDNAGFAAGTITNLAEIGNGWYKFDFGAGDLNGNVIAVRVTATGADDLGFTILTQP